jgi:hypothetical protein
VLWWVREYRYYDYYSLYYCYYYCHYYDCCRYYCYNSYDYYYCYCYCYFCCRHLLCMQGAQDGGRRRPHLPGGPEFRSTHPGGS